MFAVLNRLAISAIMIKEEEPSAVSAEVCVVTATTLVQIVEAGRCPNVVLVSGDRTMTLFW